MRALILAAGVGSRLGELTAQIPKPMLAIAGRPILESNVRLLVKHDFRDITINLHHQGDVIEDHFGDGSQYGATITYSYEPVLLGTAGALLGLQQDWDETFAIVYGDNLSTCDLRAMLRSHRHAGALVTIAVFKRENVSASGVVNFDAELVINSFVEKPASGQTTSHWVNAGVLLCERHVIRYIKHGDDFGRNVLPAALHGGERLNAYPMREMERLWWIDTLEDYNRTALEVRTADLP